MRRIIKYGVLLFLPVFFCAVWIPKLSDMSKSSRLSADTAMSARFRCQPVNKRVFEVIRDMESPGEYLAVYWLESGFGEQDCKIDPDEIVGENTSAPASLSGMILYIFPQLHHQKSMCLLKIHGCMTEHIKKKEGTKGQI